MELLLSNPMKAGGGLEPAGEGNPNGCEGGGIGVEFRADVAHTVQRGVFQTAHGEYCMNPAPFQNADDRPDHELVRLTLDGELDAFDELVRRHQGMITRSLYQFFRNHEDLEDLVQEVFIRGFRKLGTWKAPAPFHLWLRRIGYNLAYDKLRARRRNPLVNACEADPRESRDGEGRSTRGLQLRDQGTLPDVQADRSDLIDWLMSKLDADDAMILTLQYLEQVPLSEIARSVGWSVAKVKIKSFRARNRLKSLIENHENIAT